MPSSRARRDRGAVPDGGLGTRLADALRSGAVAEALEAELLAAPREQATAALRTLAAAGGADAVPLLLRVVHAGEGDLVGAAVEALGDTRSAEAAESLDEVARTAADRSVQKAARRALYRLQSQGIRLAPAA